MLELPLGKPIYKERLVHMYQDIYLALGKQFFIHISDQGDAANKQFSQEVATKALARDNQPTPCEEHLPRQASQTSHELWARAKHLHGT